MPNCAICKKSVTTSIVLCGHCAKGLAWFIDQLSEEIVLDNDIYACAMCAMSTCNSQVSGMTCRNGVKAWLLTRAKQFFPAKAA